MSGAPQEWPTPRCSLSVRASPVTVAHLDYMLDLGCPDLLGGLKAMAASQRRHELGDARRRSPKPPRLPRGRAGHVAVAPERAPHLPGAAGGYPGVGLAAEGPNPGGRPRLGCACGAGRGIAGETRLSPGAHCRATLAIEEARTAVHRLCSSDEDTKGSNRKTERTFRRDRAAFRRADACAPDRLLGDELLGEYHAYTLGAITRLVRLARAADTPHYARLWAEEAISRMYDRLIQTARRMGYFPAGQARLEQQAATDPAERQRKQAYLKGLMELAHEGLPGVSQPGARGGKGRS